ncbi:MAG: hypothetical protein H6Q35_58 [Proteobacteria bacterium]|nr:hypothetical protein [Pseudomonadota bacterium]
MTVTYEELSKLKYFSFTKEDLRDRFVPLFVIYDDEWKMYANTEKGLIPLKVVDMADGFYISQKPVRQADLKLEFFNMMLRKNNFKENWETIKHIYDDMYNLSASIEKINFFSELYSQKDHLRLCKYASVELETIFQNSRAIFENLQKIQNYLMKNTVSANKDGDNFFTENLVQFGTGENKKNKKTLTVQEYQEKYKIPELLAKFYVNFQDFFFFILENRNDIFHSRQSFTLFLGEEGFSISLNEYNLKDLHFWDEKNTLKNDLGSVKALIAYITLNTIYALEEYAKTISLIIKLPDDILIDCHIFVRSQFNETLKDLPTYVDENAWNKKEQNERMG